MIRIASAVAIEMAGKVAVRTNCDLRGNAYANEKIFGREA
jgi:hypothetical protein